MQYYISEINETMLYILIVDVLVILISNFDIYKNSVCILFRFLYILYVIFSV